MARGGPATGHAGGHSHAHALLPAADAEDRRRLAVSLGLVGAFTVGEVVAAVLAHSIALLADSGHLLVDAGALGASLIAARLASRPAGGAMTFGFKRAEILSAQANGITLLVVAVAVAVEAVNRLVHPPDVAGGVVAVVAAVGIVVNLVSVRVLTGTVRRSLNLEGALRHVLTDLYAFIGTVVAGLVVVVTGFQRADPIASLGVVALMLPAAWHLLAESGRVLLEAAPVGVAPDEVTRDLLADPRVRSAHDVHVWLITSGFPALSAHILVDPAADCHAVRRDLEAVLADRYGIEHTTLQVDHARDPLLVIERPPDAG